MMFNLMKGCEYMAATQTDAVSLLKAWFNKATNWQKDLFCQKLPTSIHELKTQAIH